MSVPYGNERSMRPAARSAAARPATRTAASAADVMAAANHYGAVRTESPLDAQYAATRALSTMSITPDQFARSPLETASPYLSRPLMSRQPLETASPYMSSPYIGLQTASPYTSSPYIGLQTASPYTSSPHTASPYMSSLHTASPFPHTGLQTASPYMSAFPHPVETGAPYQLRQGFETGSPFPGADMDGFPSPLYTASSFPDFAHDYGSY